MSANNSKKNATQVLEKSSSSSSEEGKLKGNQPQVESSYFDRSPRYHAQAEDTQRLEFYSSRNSQAPQNAYFQNISVTGMKFVSDTPVDLKVGEVLHVKFPVPHSQEAFAGQARVVRVDRGRHVAVEFVTTPQAGNEKLDIGLARAFEALKFLHLWRKLSRIRDWLAIHRLQLLGAVGAAGVFFVLLTWITQPVGNYSPERPAAWGERFTSSVREKVGFIFFQPTPEELEQMKQRDKLRAQQREMERQKEKEQN